MATTKHKHTNIGELELLESFMPDKRKEFSSAYLEKYRGKKDSTIEDFSTIKRAYYLWDTRKKQMAKLEELRKKARTVMIPAVIKKKIDTPTRSENIPDVGELLVKCHNVLVEIASVQKEQLEMFKKLAASKTPVAVVA